MNNEHFVVITTGDSDVFNKLEEELKSRKLDPHNYISYNYGNRKAMYIKGLTQDMVFLTCVICKQLNSAQDVGGLTLRMYIDMDGLSNWMSK